MLPEAIVQNGASKISAVEEDFWLGSQDLTLKKALFLQEKLQAPIRHLKSDL
jgi:hypothetical protein